MADVIVVLDQHVLPALHRAGALSHLRRMAGLVIVPDAVLWPLLVEGCGDDMDIARRTAEIFAWITVSGVQVDDTGVHVADPDGPDKGVAHWLSQRLPEHLAAGRSVIAAHAGGVDVSGYPVEPRDMREVIHRRDVIESALASSRIDIPEPADKDLADLHRYVCGEISWQELRNIMDYRYKLKKLQ